MVPKLLMLQEPDNQNSLLLGTMYDLPSEFLKVKRTSSAKSSLAGFMTDIMSFFPTSECVWYGTLTSRLYGWTCL